MKSLGNCGKELKTEIRIEFWFDANTHTHTQNQTKDMWQKQKDSIVIIVQIYSPKLEYQRSSEGGNIINLNPKNDIKRTF